MNDGGANILGVAYYILQKYFWTKFYKTSDKPVKSNKFLINAFDINYFLINEVIACIYNHIRLYMYLCQVNVPPQFYQPTPCGVHTGSHIKCNMNINGGACRIF